MASAEDYERAKQGAYRWNVWADSEIAARRRPLVDLSALDIEEVSFEGFHFPGEAHFEGSGFGGEATFRGAKFFDVALFDRAVFSKGADFREATFSRRASFAGAQFGAEGRFDVARFSGHTSFDDAHFTTNGRFQRTTFSSVVSFLRTKFEGEARFVEMNCLGDVRFSDTELKGNTRFLRSRFLSDTQFGGTNFGGAVNDFSYSYFARVADFRTAIFAAAPNLHGTTIHYATNGEGGVWRRILRRAAHPDDTARYRRMKQLASEAKDHEREISFFADELRAKRFYEIDQFLSMVPNIAYDWLSNYGRSIARPVVGLLLMIGIAWFAIIEAHWRALDGDGAKLGASFVVATTNSALLLGADKWDLRARALKTIYPGSAADLGLLGSVLAYSQSALSLFLFFLIGLALRNRFRIGGSG